MSSVDEKECRVRTSKSVWLVVLALCSAASVAQAHQLGESYLFLSIHENRIEGRVEVTLPDLDRGMGLDPNRDGKPTADEFEDRIADIRDYIEPRISLAVEGQACPIQYTTHEFLRVPIAQYAVFHFVVAGQALPDKIDVHFASMIESDPRHLGLLIVEYNHSTGVVNTTEEVSLVFDAEHPQQVLNVAHMSDVLLHLSLVGDGVWFVATDPNFVVFLALVTLPMVIVRGREGCQPVSRVGPVVLQMAGACFLCSAAHALALRVTSSSGANLSPGLLEGAVVMLIVGIGASSARSPGKAIPRIGIVVGGVFFGARAVLVWQGVPAYAVASSGRLAVDAGIGLGIVSVTTVLIPILYELRSWRLYPRVIVRYGSVALALIGIVQFST
jgi:hypothetical protein